ncbi:transposase [Niallia circulans]|uniref:TniB family NTP-binding protein n=1 Tax=Niallia circulans TaxID=1397 RepID=UPI000BA7344C|nr:TniB family NTP-binding protein [Niallia circulans]PAD25365.1 transposase [Niallia circulans]PAD88006.1 transposase [Niallia circulans]
MNELFKPLKGKIPDVKEIKKRKEHVKSIIIQYPRYKKILDKIEEHHQLSFGSVQPDGLFIYGETGLGKSTLLKEYESKYPRKIIDGFTKIPILYLTVPVGATPKSVASKILLNMGDPNYDRGTENNMTVRILSFVEKCEVEMIIVDEFQHLIDSESKNVLNKASNWVKNLSNEVRIPILVCGMPESNKVFVYNEQLDRRFCEKQSLQPFSYQSKEEEIEFRAFLNGLDKQLPFPEQAFLADPVLAKKIFYATKGNPYYIKKLIEESTVQALKSGSDLISEDDLYISFKSISLSTRPFVINPFNDEKFNLIDAFEKEKRMKKSI